MRSEDSRFCKSGRFWSGPAHRAELGRLQDGFIDGVLQHLEQPAVLIHVVDPEDD